MGRKKRYGQVTLEGIVTPSAWDADYNVVAVKLSAFGEREYEISGDVRGRELLQHVRARLKVTGRVHRDEAGGAKLVVIDYKTLDF